MVEILKEQGCPFVVVLGHPEYYSKFGFEPASVYNIKSQWEGVPDEAFMIAVFDSNLMRNSGRVQDIEMNSMKQCKNLTGRLPADITPRLA